MKTKWRLKEFYCAEFNSIMYIIQYKKWFFWNNFKLSMFLVCHEIVAHQIIGIDIVFYLKTDAIKIVNAYKKYTDRLNSDKKVNYIDLIPKE